MVFFVNDMHVFCHLIFTLIFKRSLQRVEKRGIQKKPRNDFSVSVTKSNWDGRKEMRCVPVDGEKKNKPMERGKSTKTEPTNIGPNLKPWYPDRDGPKIGDKIRIDKKQNLLGWKPTWHNRFRYHGSTLHLTRPLSRVIPLKKNAFNT